MCHSSKHHILTKNSKVVNLVVKQTLYKTKPLTVPASMTKCLNDKPRKFKKYIIDYILVQFKHLLTFYVNEN